MPNPYSFGAHDPLEVKIENGIVSILYADPNEDCYFFAAPGTTDVHKYYPRDIELHRRPTNELIVSYSQPAGEPLSEVNLSLAETVEFLHYLLGFLSTIHRHHCAHGSLTLERIFFDRSRFDSGRFTILPPHPYPLPLPAEYLPFELTQSCEPFEKKSLWRTPQLDLYLFGRILAQLDRLVELRGTDYSDPTAIISALTSTVFHRPSLERVTAFVSTILPWSLVGGRYRIFRLIGTGGTAKVYLGFDTKLGMESRRVAVKIYSRAETLRWKELNGLSKLDQEHIIKIYDHFPNENALVLQYLDGEPLSKNSSLRPKQQLELARQLCSALIQCQKAGVVHGDIKPGNIMIRRDPDSLFACLLDFGIGPFVGTPRYAAPEQTWGKLSPAADVYSFCRLLKLDLPAAFNYLPRSLQTRACHGSPTRRPDIQTINDALPTLIPRRSFFSYTLLLVLGLSLPSFLAYRWFKDRIRIFERESLSLTTPADAREFQRKCFDYDKSNLTDTQRERLVRSLTRAYKITNKPIGVAPDEVVNMLNGAIIMPQSSALFLHDRSLFVGQWLTPRAYLSRVGTSSPRSLYFEITDDTGRRIRFSKEIYFLTQSAAECQIISKQLDLESLLTALSFLLNKPVIYDSITTPAPVYGHFESLGPRSLPSDLSRALCEIAYYDSEFHVQPADNVKHTSILHRVPNVCQRDSTKYEALRAIAFQLAMYIDFDVHETSLLSAPLHHPAQRNMLFNELLDKILEDTPFHWEIATFGGQLTLKVFQE